MEKSSLQNQTPTHKLILASGSPRRREFFTQLGYTFDVVKPDVEEKLQPGETPAEYVRRNSLEKAEDVAARMGPDCVVVAADTIVVLDGRIMEKPSTEAVAFDMLRSLSGRIHQVVTGFCVAGTGTDGQPIRHAASVSTNVEFKPLDDDEIWRYIRSGEPMDKAGAYAIQGLAAYMIRRIDGSYTNVVGLPLAEVVDILTTDFNLPPPLNPA